MPTTGRIAWIAFARQPHVSRTTHLRFVFIEGSGQLREMDMRA